MSELIPIREAARRLGVSDTAVHKAIKAGRVTLASPNPDNGRPRLSWPECRDQWLANSDSSKRSHVGGTGKSPARRKYADATPEVDLPVSASGAGPGDAAGSAPGDSRPVRAPAAAHADDDDAAPARGGRGGTGGINYAESRALREAYQARLAKLEYEERSGKLVNVDHVKVEAFKTHRRIRDALLNIPDRCGPHLAALADPVECHAYLLEEIVAVLKQLSSDIYRPGGGAVV